MRSSYIMQTLHKWSPDLYIRRLWRLDHPHVCYLVQFSTGSKANIIKNLFYEKLPTFANFTNISQRCTWKHQVTLILKFLFHFHHHYVQFGLITDIHPSINVCNLNIVTIRIYKHLKFQYFSSLQLWKSDKRIGLSSIRGSCTNFFVFYDKNSLH